jgi:hypothetical protein
MKRFIIGINHQIPFSIIKSRMMSQMGHKIHGRNQISYNFWYVNLHWMTHLEELETEGMWTASFMWLHVCFIGRLL